MNTTANIDSRTDVIVTEDQIIGTTVRIFAAWEPTSWGFVGAPHHSTIRHFGERAYGRVGTRDIACDAPAGSDERIAAVRAAYAAQFAEAYAAIRNVYRHITGTESGGEIVVDSRTSDLHPELAAAYAAASPAPTESA